MFHRRRIARLMLEILLVVAAVETAIVFAAPHLSERVPRLLEPLVNTAALSLIAGPIVLWRVLAASYARGAGKSAAAKPDRLHYMIAPAILIVGAAISFWLGASQWQKIRDSAVADFRVSAGRIAKEAERRLFTYEYGLRGTRGLFVASKSVEYEEFKSYVESRDLAAEFPGALGLGYIERVARPALSEFLAAVKADQGMDIEIKTRGDAPDLYVIKFIEPLALNRQARGLDIASEPIRRAAAESAMLTGRPTLSGRVTLVQDEKQRPGFLYLIPHYRNGTRPATADERREALVGWVYLPLVIEQALANVVPNIDDRIVMEVYDGNKPTAANVLFDSDPQSINSIDDPRASPGALAISENIVVGNREWTLLLRSKPSFDNSYSYVGAPIVSMVGLFLSLLLAGIVWTLGNSRNSALALANEMTHELRASEGAAQEARAAAERAVEKLTSVQAALEHHCIYAATDAAGTITDVNKLFCDISGYSREELLGANHRLINSGRHGKEFWAHVWRTIASGKVWSGEICNKRKDGTHYWVQTSISPMKDANGKITQYIALRADVTALKLLEIQLGKAAKTDKLTGLINRSLFQDRLQEAVRRARMAPGYKFAVLFLDFDRFKQINDCLGHNVGDLLLVEIARRLRGEVRSSDSLSAMTNGHSAARLGGDEFVVLLDDIASAQAATSVADRLISVFSQPYLLGEHEVFSSASIGIVLCGETVESAEAVLRDADTAMYEAKMAGKGRYLVFDASMRQRVQNRLEIETELRKAIAEKEFTLAYQPIVAMDTGSVEGFEALIRWKHPRRGFISPGEFIPIAEDTGLIIPIGEWVLREACAQMASWQARLGESAPRKLSINLSRNQLLLPNLPTIVKHVLDDTGVKPSSIVLEITESAVMRDAALAKKLLAEIKALGVRLAMDDFGTGYSSLACLHDFPFDILKIDRSFIANIQRGRGFAALVHAVTQLAGNLGVLVVAEGVETLEQVLALQSLECAFGQGYFFGKPMPAEHAATFRVNPGTLPGGAEQGPRKASA